MTGRVPCPVAPGPLEAYAARFDPLFGTLAQRRGFREYLQGLLLPRDLIILIGVATLGPALTTWLGRANLVLDEGALMGLQQTIGSFGQLGGTARWLRSAVDWRQRTEPAHGSCTISRGELVSDGWFAGLPYHGSAFTLPGRSGSNRGRRADGFDRSRGSTSGKCDRYGAPAPPTRCLVRAGDQPL